MPNDYLNWIIVYLIFGAVLILSLRYFNQVIKDKKSKRDFASDLMDAFKKDHPELNKRTIDREELIFMIIGYLIWPISILILIIGSVFPSLLQGKPIPYDPEDDFLCKRNHLIKQVSPEEVEAASYIQDPLGRTPNKPFGHLSIGWQNFLTLHESGYQLWAIKIPGNYVSFKSKKDNGREWSVPQDEKIGYAWVHKGKIKAEFFTEWD